MRTSRAVGAIALALAAAVTLSGCTDNPEDKAFGGAGSLGKPPKIDPSAMPSIPMPSMDPDRVIGGASGGDSGVTGGGSGGSGVSGGSSGGSSGGAGAPAPPTKSARPTFNPNASGEVVGSNCSASRSGSVVRFTYDVDIQNASSEHAFVYTFAVTFKVSASASSKLATETLATRNRRVTVGPSGSRKITLSASRTSNEAGKYACRLDSPRKSLSR
ncbi:hypothetical protein ACX6XY_05125 [Streptomyces sp. O3]